jgi:hypothetical protein
MQPNLKFAPTAEHAAEVIDEVSHEKWDRNARQSLS